MIEARCELATRLAERRLEIEAAVSARIRAISGQREISDPEYALGLRAAVAAGLDYGLAALREADGAPPPIPSGSIRQARLAADCRLGLDKILRRYVAAYGTFTDFVIEEATAVGSFTAADRQAMRHLEQSALDRLMATIGEEHAKQSRAREERSTQRRLGSIRRLLAGEPVNAAQLDYFFDGWHLGVVGVGGAAPGALREVGIKLDRRLLLASPDEEVVWAWFGGRNELDVANFEGAFAARWPSEAQLAIGEPNQGIAGWRLSHEQAVAALSIARRTSEPLIRYRDVAVFASILRDDLLVASLRELYLKPLETGRDNGESLRETLCAYFAAGGVVTSAAAHLGISRQAVRKRLQAAECRIGRPLGDCGVELEAALRLHGLTSHPNHPAA